MINKRNKFRKTRKKKSLYSRKNQNIRIRIWGIQGVQRCERLLKAINICEMDIVHLTETKKIGTADNEDIFTIMVE